MIRYNKHNKNDIRNAFSCLFINTKKSFKLNNQNVMRLVEYFYNDRKYILIDFVFRTVVFEIGCFCCAFPEKNVIYMM